jgi:signal transduction histidine kinase
LRFVPDTLFGRLISAVLGVVAVAVLVVVVLIVRDRRELLFAGSEAEAIATTIAETTTQLAALSGDARAAEVERLAMEPLTILRGASRRGVPFSPYDVTAALETLPARLASDLGESYRVAVRFARPGPHSEAIRVRIERSGERAVPPPEGLFPPPGTANGPPDREGPPEDGERGPLSQPREAFGLGRGGGPPREIDVVVTLPDGANVEFRADVPRAGPPLPRRIFVDLAVLTLGLAAVLYLMARTTTRPLTELARAAEAVGRGERRAPLRETGARELREATRAFNAMQERLHRYLDSRTQVLAAMSHDLRTPLTRLKLRAESLDDDVLREKFNADLDEMQRMVAGALNLFKGMNHDEPLQPVRMGALVDEIRGEFAEMGTKIEVTGVSAEPVLARPSELKRCLTNLVSNAVKYGSSPAIAIEDGSSEITIRVSDDGPGIPPEMLEQVFEPFFRLEGSRSIDTGGVGLGLSIARDIAQGHGGSLTLANRSPHGLEATLRLPRAGAR